MKRRHTRRIGTIAILLGMLVFLVGAGACSNGSNEESETVDLLNDPEVGLAQLSGELNVVSELATDPKMGFDHLNEELHTIRKLATDPKVGFGHLNEEAHAVKQMVSDLSGQVSLLETQVEELQSAETQAAALQRQLDRGVAIMEVFDVLTTGFENLDETSDQDYIELFALVHDSGNFELKAKLVEMIDAVHSEMGVPPTEASGRLPDGIKSSSNGQVREKFQEYREARAEGKGAVQFLELVSLAGDSGDPALESLLVRMVEHLTEVEPSFELIEEFDALVSTLPTGGKIRQAWNDTGVGSFQELIEQVGTKLKAIGDPSLEALWEKAVRSDGDEEFEAFWQGVFAALRKTLS